MKANKLLAIVFGVVAFVVSSSVVATTVVGLSEIRISGFMSAVGTASDTKEPYGKLIQITDDYDFGRETMLGLQIDAKLSDQLMVTTQLLADRDPDNYSLQADWVYAKYSFNKNLSFKFGRLRIPVFMYSDYVEVGLTYSWIRPPAEVYGLVPVNAFTGGDVLWNLPVHDYNFLIQGTFGNGELDTKLLSLSGDSTIDMRKGFGLNLMFSTDNHVFRVGYLGAELDIFDNGLELFQKFGAAGVFSGLSPHLMEGVKVIFYGFGTALRFGSLGVAMEYVTRELSESVIDSKNTGSYLALEYNVDKFHPHVTIAYTGATTGVSILDVEQRSVTLGMKYELSQNAVIKGDYIHIDLLDGSQGYFNEALPTGKDKAKIYSIALDLVF